MAMKPCVGGRDANTLGRGPSTPAGLPELDMGHMLMAPSRDCISRATDGPLHRCLLALAFSVATAVFAVAVAGIATVAAVLPTVVAGAIKRSATGVPAGVVSSIIVAFVVGVEGGGRGGGVSATVDGF